MSDIKIHLVRYATEEEDPIRTLEASYRDVARMDSRTLVDRITDHVVDAVDDRHHGLVLRDETGLQISQSFQTFGEQSLIEQELRMHAERLVRAYRRCSQHGGSDD